MYSTKRFRKKVNELEEIISNLSDTELRNKTAEYKKQIKENNKVNFLVEAFAVVREATKRVTGKRLYDVQIIGGYVLNQGKIAEIKAGEGKTLIEVLPIYINALDGNGVHVVTTNEYLAERDYNEIGKILEFLGISVGLIKQGMDIQERQGAYNKDVTYGTNTEFGFDYLRDNIVGDKERMVQRGLNYAIIDEADSILIDEGNLPLIIASKKENTNIKLYKKADAFVKSLNSTKISKEEYKNKKQHKEIEKYDYYVNEKNKTAFLTKKGIEKAEKRFGIDNLYSSKNIEILSILMQVLRANGALKKDVDYIVENNKVYIIDKFTGRVMKEKRFTNGLHEALEVKENVEIGKGSETIATITVQNYFKQYSKISGMSGTVKTSEDEFNSIYSLDVVKIPTNKPVIRIDHKDRLFFNEEDKFKAVVDEVKNNLNKKQPILIGTSSVEKSEIICKMLDELSINYNLLNAKNHEKEAEIVKQAGNVGAITISTNMAGRGTNIVVSDEAIKLGGLKVIGTEKFESIRIDEQLRGRSGRQGQKGESIFFLSLDDEIIRIFGDPKKISKYKKSKLNRMVSKRLSKEYTKAQKKVESLDYELRKNLVKTDDILGKYRNVIYRDRKKVIESRTEEIFYQFLHYFCDKIVCSNDIYAKNIRNRFIYISANKLENEIKKEYDQQRKMLGIKKNDYVVKTKILRTIDRNWIEFINIMESVLDEVTLRSFTGDDPIDEYIIQSGKHFEILNERIKLNSVTQVLFGVDYEECVDSNWN
ncbi:MAG: preprotein translocase subunit SecA [Clostridia bacterium]|nr:preprotein translocase subunit SecA [Clostridia bacterium]